MSDWVLQTAETMGIMDHLISPDTSNEFVSSVNATEFFNQLFFKDEAGDTNPVKTE